MEAATVQEQKSATIYLENTSKDTQVVSDLGKNGVWPSADDKFDVNVRPISRERSQSSMGVQLLMTQGILKEISQDEMREKISGHSSNKAKDAAAAGGNASFEGDLMGEDITPSDIQQQNTANQVAKANPDEEIDTSQKVPDLEQNQ